MEFDSTCLNGIENLSGNVQLDGRYKLYFRSRSTGELTLYAPETFAKKFEAIARGQHLVNEGFTEEFEIRD